MTLHYATLDGTAIQNLDYVPASGTVTFAPGVTSQTVSVQVLPENKTTNETFYVVLSSTAGAPGVNILTAQGSCEIRGQNSEIFIAGVSVNRPTTGTTSAYVRVYLDKVSAKTISCSLVTIDGTARGKVDYTPVSSVVTFSPGQITKSIAIPIIGIKTAVPTRIFTAKLMTPVAGNGWIEVGSGAVTIVGHN